MHILYIHVQTPGSLEAEFNPMEYRRAKEVSVSMRAGVGLTCFHENMICLYPACSLCLVITSSNQCFFFLLFALDLASQADWLNNMIGNSLQQDLQPIQD